jgi:hypothetical protein
MNDRKKKERKMNERMKNENNNRIDLVDKLRTTTYHLLTNDRKTSENII